MVIHGVWTTGEWLFHEKGWAWDKFGLPLIDRLSKGQVELNLVLADNPLGHTERQVRGQEVRRLLEAFLTCRIYPVSWWQQNRVLTLINWASRDGSRKEAGIYMRRRLATPIVSPVLVRGDDCWLLHVVFSRYQQKSSRRQPGP